MSKRKREMLNNDYDESPQQHKRVKLMENHIKSPYTLGKPEDITPSTTATEQLMNMKPNVSKNASTVTNDCLDVADPPKLFDPAIMECMHTGEYAHTDSPSGQHSSGLDKVESNSTLSSIVSDAAKSDFCGSSTDQEVQYILRHKNVQRTKLIKPIPIQQITSIDHKVDQMANDKETPPQNETTNEHSNQYSPIFDKESANYPIYQKHLNNNILSKIQSANSVLREEQKISPMRIVSRNVVRRVHFDTNPPIIIPNSKSYPYYFEEHCTLRSCRSRSITPKVLKFSKEFNNVQSLLRKMSQK